MNTRTASGSDAGSQSSNSTPFNSALSRPSITSTILLNSAAWAKNRGSAVPASSSVVGGST
eukprot:30980-Pelagococcus_subviridis.AAC.17